MSNKHAQKLRRISATCISVTYFVTLIMWSTQTVHAASLLLNRYDKISDSNTSAVTRHDIGFSYTNFFSAVGSVYMEFCSNNPVISDACVAPAGFSASSAILSSQSGETGFSIHPSSTVNKIILTRALTVPVTGPSDYVLTGITNPNTVNTYFIRLATFTANNGTGIPIEEGGIALAANTPFSVSAEVPPFIRFCVGVTLSAFDCSTATSFFIDFGEFSTTQVKSASAQMIAGSNAQNGYSISLSGTTLTSGNNVIQALASPTTSSPGTSQFGINLRANSSPTVGSDAVGAGSATPTANYNTPNKFMYQAGDAVASGNVSQDYKRYTISYIANISSSQPSGVYATTVTFICLANF